MIGVLVGASTFYQSSPRYLIDNHSQYERCAYSPVLTMMHLGQKLRVNFSAKDYETMFEGRSCQWKYWNSCSDSIRVMYLLFMYLPFVYIFVEAFYGRKLSEILNSLREVWLVLTGSLACLCCVMDTISNEYLASKYEY